MAISRLTRSRKSDSETDGIFKLRIVENLRRSIKRYLVLFTYTLYSRIQYCSHIQYDDMALIDDVALTDDVVGCYWTKILMCH